MANSQYRYKNKTVEEYRKEWYATKSVEYHMFNHAKSRAKRLGLPFAISIEDIVVPEYCPYLGVKIVRSEGSVKPDSPSLDKIIPELGYVPGNIEVISFRANTMKSNCNPETLVKFAKKILEKFDLLTTNKEPLGV